MKATIGTIIHGTMRSEDLIPAFAAELERLGPKKHDFVSLVKEAKAVTDFDSDEAQCILEGLFDALNWYAPDGAYFGSHEGDGSDYGFWQSPDAAF